MKRETIIKGLKELVKKGWEINEEEGTIKNPETGRTIKIKTALSYDPSHPAYKLAQKQSGGDSGDGGEEEKEYDSSGETDYFEYYEDLPDNIDKLMDKYFMEEPTFDYDELSDIRDEFKQQGWTFDVGLDGDPIDLRPLRDDEKTSTEEPKSSSSETGNDVSFDYDEHDNSLTFSDGEKVKVDYDGDFQYKDEWFNVNDYENEDELKQAIADKVGSKNENKSMKISKSRLREIVKEVIKEESDYQEFFKRALEKTGKSIPQMSDEEKKAFFNKIDKAWKGKGEKNEGNAFGAAVTKAKEQGKDTFKVGGKTYKVKESVVSEAMYDKNKLMKLMRKHDDALIRTNKGKEFIIYSPFNNNDDNTAMWGNDFVIAIDKNSDEHKIRYRDIVKFIGESVNEQSSNRDIMAISRMTGVPDYKIEDFVRKHKLKDLKKVKKLVKGMGSKKDERFAQIVGGKFSMVSDFKDKYKNS